ncbi:MAG TPA: hypothetical protein VHB54_15935 [Mucilaginibacter sp.]|nr:hypothetical protein [Mucilaginibacter sp.]
MVKYLPVIILCFLIFSVPVRAQSHADSVANRPTIDSALKPVDTTVKKVAVHEDTATVHHGADSLAKRDTVIKSPAADSVVKQTRADTVVKAPASVVPPKMKVNKGKAVHPIVRSVAKQATADTLMHSPVKTLSDERYTMLVKGEDFDHMSLAGELNHYPLPDKALKYKVQLGLNPGQLTQLKAIAAGLQRKKVEMGQDIINNERKLDTLFKTRQADDGSIIFYTNRYGLYLGEIRNAVLQACYKTEAVLSEAQIKKLEGLSKIK